MAAFPGYHLRLYHEQGGSDGSHQVVVDALETIQEHHRATTT